METLMLLLLLGTTSLTNSVGTVETYSFDESFLKDYEEGVSFHQSHGDYIWSVNLLNFTPPQGWLTEDFGDRLEICPPTLKPEIAKEEQCVIVSYFEGNSKKLYAEKIAELQAKSPVRLNIENTGIYGTTRVSWDVYKGAHLPEHYEARRFYLQSVDLLEFKVGSYVNEDLVLDILTSISFG